MDGDEDAAVARLLSQRLGNVDHEACTVGHARACLIRLRAQGYNRCPECQQPTGEPTGANVVAASDAGQSAGEKRLPDFRTGGVGARGQRQRAAQ